MSLLLVDFQVDILHSWNVPIKESLTQLHPYYPESRTILGSQSCSVQTVLLHFKLFASWDMNSSKCRSTFSWLGFTSIYSEHADECALNPVQIIEFTNVEDTSSVMCKNSYIFLLEDVSSFSWTRGLRTEIVWKLKCVETCHSLPAYSHFVTVRVEYVVNLVKCIMCFYGKLRLLARGQLTDLSLYFELYWQKP